MSKNSQDTTPSLVAVLVVTLGLLCGSASADATYYQVTFGNGTVRDMTEIPKSRKGIRRVVRIARFEADSKEYRVTSTKGPALRLVNTGRTVKEDLAWNGAAWVAPREKSRSSAPPPEPAAMSEIQQEMRRVEGVLKGLEDRLKQLDHAVAAAERELASQKETKPEPPGAKKLDKVVQDRKNLLETIGQYKRTLNVLKDTARAEDNTHPARKVERLRLPPEKSDFGVVIPTAKRTALPHRVHVWKLPPGKGPRTYVVSMKHPESGRLGALRYVAYADTDDDGAPDKLLAQSDLASVEAPGKWTQWTFTTSNPSVFAGCDWIEPTASVYHQQTSPDEKNWRGAEVDVYTAPFFGGIPRKRWKHQPYLSNIRIRVNQNPPPPSSGPAVIFR